MSDDEGDFLEAFDATEGDLDIADDDDDGVPDAPPDAADGSSVGASDDEGSSAGEPDSDEEPTGADSDDDAGATGAPARPEPARADPFARAAQLPRAIYVVAAADRVTDDRLQPTEAAQLLAFRAAQIAANGRCFAPPELTGGVGDTVRLAYIELFARRCPLTLRREVGVAPDGGVIVEDWCPRDMTLPQLPMGDGSDPAFFPQIHPLL